LIAIWLGPKVDEHLYVTVCQYFYVIVSIYILNPDDIYTIILYDVWLDTHQIRR
jgi:hypothetical protein